MSDLLLRLGRSRVARELLRRSGLPVAMPVELWREETPWAEPPLPGTRLGLGGTQSLRRELEVLGATLVEGDAGASLDALVFDAREVGSVEGAAELHRFFAARLAALALSRRVVVVGCAEGEDPGAAALTGLLTGFVRSLARELGRRGSTAHLVLVARGAEPRLPALLAFLLSARSAFVSGQVWRVGDEVRDLACEPTWQRPLAGRRALVTGAGQGIGAAVARALAREGASVLCIDRPGEGEARLRALASECGGAALCLDVAAADAGERMAAAVSGGLDILVHNAGIVRDRTLARMSAEEWDQVLEVNLAAVFRTTPTLLAGPIREGGRVLVMASISGIGGNAGQCNYAAAKAGLIHYVQALAPRLAGRGITANALAPGLIDTPMTRGMSGLHRELARRANALSQAGRATDVAELALFLATPGASGISGQTLRVCGMNLLGA